jgi:hypothetical protein
MTTKTSYYLYLLCLLLASTTAMAEHKDTPINEGQLPAASQFANSQLHYKINAAAKPAFCYAFCAAFSRFYYLTLFRTFYYNKYDDLQCRSPNYFLSFTEKNYPFN